MPTFIKNIKLTLFIFFIFCSKTFAGGIKILEWKEFANLTEYGRESRFILKVQAKDLAKDVGILSFSISNPNQNKVEYSAVKVDFAEARYDNKNGAFEIIFNKPLFNEQTLNIEFNYKEFYSKISKYLRQEPLYIPSFAIGALGVVEININEDYELISNHKNIFSSERKIIYKGKVPAEGIKEVLKLTNSGVIWDVLIRNKVKITPVEGVLEATVPYLFRGGAQSVRNQTIGANLFPKKHISTRENDVLTFDITPQISEVVIENKAQVATGKRFRIENNRAPDNYLNISDAEQFMLSPILKKIMLDPKYDSMPLYVKILNYVHENIKYDLKYYGKLLSVEQILATKSGVCIEYATLFNALARLAKIPSSIVHGYALGEYDKFEGHAWNMIFVDNHWIHVDPTWNLSSGIVSSSHIYLKDNRKEDILINFQGKELPKIDIDGDFEITDSNKSK